MSPVYIHSIGTAVPKNQISQKELCIAIENNSSLDRRSRLLLRNIYNSTGIEKRHTVLDDFLGHSLFSQEEAGNNFPVSERMRIFEKTALQLCKTAVQNCLDSLIDFNKRDITHVIAFSCTGMYAPGLDIEIIEELGLNPEAERTCINFMGCYAAVNALKSAFHIARSQPHAKILLTGVELCSLHYMGGKEQEQMIANAIFSDGAAAVILSSDESIINKSNVKLSLREFHSDFYSAGKNEMVWSIGDAGFNLRLSASIPRLLHDKAGLFFKRLLHKSGIEERDVNFYAIHPGGIKILEACEAALSLTKTDNRHSYEVLKQYGNMSSVTILFVLNEYLKSLQKEDQGKNIAACAFGPGITMESMLLQVA